MLGAAGRSEFFAREAADYLRALTSLLGDPPPEGEEFVRLARALRGAAMLAGPASYTRAASQLEQVAKLYRQGHLTWPPIRPLISDAIGELTELARAAGAWSGAEDERTAMLADALGELLAGAEPAPAVPTAAPSAEGMRAFVAREAAALAGTLNEAARTLGQGGPAPGDALSRVSRAMQSLRGLAGLTELAPLPDLLDATDCAVRELQRYPALPAGAAEFCATAAEACSRLARQVAERGRPDQELPEAHRVADRLLHLLTGPGIVEIDSLDGGAPVLERRERRFAEPLDLASLGERLCAGADQLRAAPSRAAARLQALVLLAVLRDAPGGLGRRPAGRFVAQAIRALDEAAREGHPPSLADTLDRAGRMLVEGARTDLSGLEAALDQLQPAPAGAGPEQSAVVDITTLAPTPARPALDLPADRTRLERSLSRYSRLVREQPAVPALAPAPEPVPVPIAALAPDEPEPVPVDQLAPEGPAAVPVATLAPDGPAPIPIAALAPEESEPVPVEFLAPLPEPIPVELLAPDLESGPVSLTAPAPEPPAPVPIEALAPEPELRWVEALAPVAREPVPIDALAPDPDIVPIERLIYSGRAALERADQIRRELEASLRTASDELDRIEPLVRELLDLVPLALVDPDA